MDRVITSQDYQDMKGRVEKDIVLAREKLSELHQQTSPFKDYIQNQVPMLENLLEFCRKSDGATKKKILNTNFAEKLILVNGKVTAPTFTEPIQLIFRISEVLKGSERKKEVYFDQSLVASLTKKPIFEI